MWLAIVQSKVLATVLATVLVKLVVRIDQEAARVISRGKGGGQGEGGHSHMQFNANHHSSRTTGYREQEGSKRMAGNGLDFHLFLYRINLKGKFREAT